MKKNETPYQDFLHKDGGKTYDTVYGFIYISQAWLVDEIEGYCLGQWKRERFLHLLERGQITQVEYTNIMRIID